MHTPLVASALAVLLHCLSSVATNPRRLRSPASLFPADTPTTAHGHAQLVQDALHLTPSGPAGRAANPATRFPLAPILHTSP